MNISPVIAPKYVAEVNSFSRIGNLQRTFDLQGQTAAEIIEVFDKVKRLEYDEGYEAYLPPDVYRMAELENEQPIKELMTW